MKLEKEFTELKSMLNERLQLQKNIKDFERAGIHANNVLNQLRSRRPMITDYPVELYNTQAVLDEMHETVIRVWNGKFEDSQRDTQNARYRIERLSRDLCKLRISIAEQSNSTVAKVREIEVELISLHEPSQPALV